MPLRTPVLDDRSYEQLRDELVSRISVYAPEWSDHQPSDPGITLIELFAFLSENLLFRFNQIPDATRMEFLRLLQMSMRPAQPATAMLQLSTVVPAGVRVELQSHAVAGKVAFETQDEVHVWPLDVRAAVREAVALPTDDEAAEFVERAAAARGRAKNDVSTYQTRIATGEPTRPGGDVVDPTASVDGILWIAVMKGDATDVAQLAGGLLSIGVSPSETVLAMADVSACPGAGAAANDPPMEWQISTLLPGGAIGDPAATDPLWRKVEVVADSSGGLTRPGVVRLQLPTDMTDIGVFVPADPDAIGTGDQPPVVEDDATDAAIVFWLRVFRPSGGAIGAVEWLGTNATRVEQAVTSAAEFLGTGTGEPDQSYRLVHPSVLGNDIALDVEERGSQWTPWQLVDDFHASGIEDRHYTLDREAGAVTFGDGVRGRAPQIGERIRTRRYRYGGGADGNVAAKAIDKVEGQPLVTAKNPLPARGARLRSRSPTQSNECRASFAAVIARSLRQTFASSPG